MKKIPTLFQRDFANNPRYVTQEVNPDAQWVIDGEGIATRKYDGMCCMVEDGKLWKRSEIKKGQPEPMGFRLADEDTTTGKKQGWLEVGWGNEDKWFREAVGGDPDKVSFSNGTYELVGPKSQGNPEGYDKHTLLRHSEADKYQDFPRDYEGIKERLSIMHVEGIVWHHPDGRMVKIKKRDFKD